MATVNSAGAQDPDKTKTKNKIVVTESDFLDISFPFRPFLSESSKVLHDYLMKEDVSDKRKTPEILDALFNTLWVATDDEVNIDKFNDIINEILPFDSRTNELHNKKIQKIWDGIKTVKEKERLRLLSKKRVDALPRVENSFKYMCERYNEIQIEIEEFKCKELPEAVAGMRTLVIRGFLCKLNLSNYHKMINQCINLSNRRIVTLKKIEEFRYTVNCLIQLTNPNTGRKSICRSDHNIPFCKICSWQTSWLKNFKKKGVYVKEVDISDSNQMWYNQESPCTINNSNTD